MGGIGRKALFALKRLIDLFEQAIKGFDQRQHLPRHCEQPQPGGRQAHGLGLVARGELLLLAFKRVFAKKDKDE